MKDTDKTALLECYARTPSDEVMAQLVECWLPLSDAVARRFRGRGVDTEDLCQVAAMALMKAIRRFDPDKGIKFSTFAIPTIAGEVRNHIRDKAALVRVSRDMRESVIKLNRVTGMLAQKLMREPTVAEIAAEMKITPEELLRILDSRDSMEITSLSETLPDDDRQLQDRLGLADSGYEQVEQRDWWNWVMSRLTVEEQKLVRLRYIERKGQRDCAAQMNISQMQVSRMERRMLSRIREIMIQTE